MADVALWPNLTEFADDRVLGASALRDYSDAVNLLLAESLAPYALQRCQEFAPSSSYSSYQVAGDWYQYHQANTVYYRVYLKNESAIGTTYARFYYVDGAGAETAIGSEFSVYSYYWSLCTGTIDVSGLGLTVGQPYRLRLRIKGNNSSNRPFSEVWGLGEQLSMSGWATPHTFVNGATSAAADLNTWRSALTALHNYLSPVNPLTMCASSFDIPTSGSAQLYFGATHRYQPDQMYVAIEIKTYNTTAVEWYVDRYSDPATYTRRYTSSALPNTYGAYTWYSVPYINEASAGLTVGSYYKYAVKAMKPSNDATIKRAVIIRIPAAAPAATWYTPAQFAHGDTAISAATLNAISADINRFYSGGANEFWGQVPAVGYLVSASTRNFSGVHRKRWLNYLGTSSDQININYGLGYSGVVTSLPRQTYWQSYDLESSAVPLGARYVVEGVACAFESDEAVA